MEGETVEVMHILFSELYDLNGETPPQIQINVLNPKSGKNDSFYFLKETDGINYNSIQSNENEIDLLEVYMTAIPKSNLTPTEFISSVLMDYFIAKEGFSLKAVD